jgi:AMMECR1 domain-containing protein
VTWYKRKGTEKELRGCIGTFQSLPLHNGLIQYAKHSAFNDTRFDPITIHELPYLECSVSILFNFEPATNHLDWEVRSRSVYNSDWHPWNSDFLYF